MATVIDPEPATPPTTGLLASARSGSSIRFDGMGVSWRGERCIITQGFSLCDEIEGLPDEPIFGPYWYFPAAFRLRDYCTTISGELDTARLRRQAEAVTSFEVAQELWTGALTTAAPGDVGGDPYINAHLASDDAVTVAVTGTLADKLAQLEQAAMVASKGQRVFLHVPVSMVTPIANLLRRSGNLLLTALDNVVVADAGYPGTGPAGTGTTWAYATGPVAVRLSEVFLAEGRDATNVDRSINRQEVWAERAFAATFDPCIHFAANLAEAG